LCSSRRLWCWCTWCRKTTTGSSTTKIAASLRGRTSIATDRDFLLKGADKVIKLSRPRICRCRCRCCREVCRRDTHVWHHVSHWLRLLALHTSHNLHHHLHLLLHHRLPLLKLLRAHLLKLLRRQHGHATTTRHLHARHGHLHIASTRHLHRWRLLTTRPRHLSRHQPSLSRGCLWLTWRLTQVIKRRESSGGHGLLHCGWTELGCNIRRRRTRTWSTCSTWSEAQV